MIQDTRGRVTAQDFYDYEKCPHRVYLNHNGTDELKLPQSEFLELLFSNALTHEWEVIKGLDYETPVGGSMEDRAEMTRVMMGRGVDRIFQGVLLQPTESGRPDLLERVPGRSRLGDFYYKPVDIKAGSGVADSHSQALRQDYGMQLFHYGHLLNEIQGAFPLEGEILNRRKERVRYPLVQFGSSYSDARAEIEALVAGTKTDEPALCGECGKCQWWGHCENVLVAVDDVTLLADVGRKKKIVLAAAGVRSIQDLAKFDFSTVELKGIGEKTAESLKRSANAVLANKIEILSKPSIPNPKRKIYLDFEDDPTQDLIYLCGLWIEPPIRGLNYHGLFCTDESGEARIWSELQGLMEGLACEDYVVFHFAPYEKTKISVLERKHGVADKTSLETFRNRMVDLHTIVKKCVVLPTRGYGLKEIAAFVGFKYSASNAGGAQSIVWFQKYQQDPSDTDVMGTLLQYNREDCLAMKFVDGWLRAL